MISQRVRRYLERQDLLTRNDESRILAIATASVLFAAQEPVALENYHPVERWPRLRRNNHPDDETQWLP
jgi:hypothetical protein